MLNHFPQIRQTAGEDLSQLLLSYWGSHQDSSTPRGFLFNLQGGTKAVFSIPDRGGDTCRRYPHLRKRESGWIKEAVLPTRVVQHRNTCQILSSEFCF